MCHYSEYLYNTHPLIIEIETPIDLDFEGDVISELAPRHPGNYWFSCYATMLRRVRRVLVNSAQSGMTRDRHGHSS